MQIFDSDQADPRRTIARALATATLLIVAPSFAQDTTDEPEELPAIDLGRMIITATRTPHVEFESPHATRTIAELEIRRRLIRSTPRVFEFVPGVSVQETSAGQGSPFVRGFTGFRNVLLIDGIRLNNSVFRDGPNQYWNTVDPLSIERYELVMGPSSVLYGSDAIGGTIQAITRSPTAVRDSSMGTRVAGELFVRGASAENSILGRAQVDIAAPDSWGLLLGLGGKSFGDLVAGEEVGTQRNTGYEEWDVDAKLQRAFDIGRLTIGYQHVRQNDVPRTHRTVFAEPFRGTTVGSDLVHDLDQERQLAYVQLRGSDYMLGLSWHAQREERARTRANGNRERQGFDVNTLGFIGSMTLADHVVPKLAGLDSGRLTVGFDFYSDAVDSFSSTNPIQGPVADDARYDLFGVFVQDELEVSDALSVILGVRFNHAAADAERVRDPVSGLPISIDEEWGRFVSSARALVRATSELHFFGGVSQGFRAPNLSDLTRFDSARTNEFEIAAPALEPETFVSYELGAKHRSQHGFVQLAAFYTDIEDAIVRVPTGATNPAGEFEISKENVGDGYVWGLEASGTRELGADWSVTASGTFIEGRVETFPTSAPVAREEYLDRLMPTTLRLGFEWEPAEDPRSRWFRVDATWVDDADRLSTRDALDTSRIPPGGTPGYVRLDLGAGLRLGRSITFNVALENLTDEDYRVHGSGQNASGRSLVLGLTLSR